MTDCTIQKVFQQFYDGYKRKHKLSGVQRKAAAGIKKCRTGELGGHVSVCEECGKEHIHYNSCRNRCCPMCQELPRERWIDARREDVVDAPYFHVVFTVPAELNSLIYQNQKLLYDAMNQSVSESLNEMAADKNHLGAKIGHISILHTWGSEMNYHPHIHCIVLGGGLNEKKEWKECSEKYFLPVRQLMKIYRGKYMEKLKGYWKEGELETRGTAERYRNYYTMKELIERCYGKEWVVYSKESFDGAEGTIKYLGEYTHRIAISNSRIVAITEEEVTYLVKDYNEEGKWKEKTIGGEEFIRRFLMHVPPKRYVRIRHYGLLANRNKGKNLVICRNLIGCKKYLSKLKGLDIADLMKELYQVDIEKCKGCGGRMVNPGKKRIQKE